MTAGSPPRVNGSAPPAVAAGDDRPVLDIRGLSIAYRTPDGDVPATRGVDLALRPGQIVGLAGESGCGKSTLAYGAVRLLRPPAVITAGRVTYHGRRAGAAGVDVLAATRAQLRSLRWREIAIVFQSAMNALNPVLRIGEQLHDAIAAHLRLAPDEAQARVETMIELVGIPRGRLRSYPHELSGGMRQRVMIAMALAVEPEVVIMDEPTTGLDVVVQREILSEIFALRTRLGFSVLFITHDLSLLLEIADQIVIMYAGQIIESAPTGDIVGGGAHPYTRGLIGSFPRLHGPRRTLAGIPGSPPDLRSTTAGCPFAPRCGYAGDACATVDMALIPAPPAGGSTAGDTHLTACPFDTTGPAPHPPAAAGERRAGDRPAGDRAAGGTPSDAERDDAPGRALVLEAVDLSKEYRLARGGRAAVVRAVKEVSLCLRRGSVVALVGESGSGKSTIAKLLAGQERRTGGQILLDGAAIDPASRRGFRAYKREVQMIFQDPFASLNPLHTVRYHLERALAVHSPRTGRPATEAEVDRLLEQVHMRPAGTFRAAFPHELSGGQRQRVSIARALAAEPRVLLADEPVSMLDVSIRLEVLDLIQDLRSTLHLAVLYITHDIASARYFADEILVMHDGAIVERGPAERVTQDPQHPYTRLLIDASPDPDTFARQLDDGAPAPASRDPERTAHEMT